MLGQNRCNLTGFLFIETLGTLPSHIACFFSPLLAENYMTNGEIKILKLERINYLSLRLS